ncbi:MAG: type II toxin-antitoxin system prevent-host-death family antitoxin [Actinomycetota bacterium]|nr:type II toxin-antitoxin system prevent-host-death family antitoxin [Actinomycetota bacterium]
MPAVIPISEAKGRLAQVVRDAEEHDVILLRHGRPAAMVIGAERYDAINEELEDLRDRLAVYERDHVTIGIDKLIAELGED